MFVATALLYPCVLAALCAGAGLLVDRCSGGFLPAPLILTVGAAALIAVSQLTTYAYVIAPATPYVMAGVALAGFALAWGRVRAIARRCREGPWTAAVPVLAYVLALAPVLFAGRATFSSYLALADSAVHMVGADFLIRHGQNYAHLDLRNSYGQYINGYYNTSYPSGADTLFGGSAFLMGLPLIWAFQPFNAFMLATAAGPAWLLARRMRLDGPWAALAALTAVLPALVYAYELFASVKEITALPMILALGCLVLLHRSWLRGPPARAIPFALVFAGGVSALGAAFGAWALVAVAVLAAVLLGELRAGRQDARRSLLLAGGGAIALLIAAWPTWVDLSGSLRVAESIAATNNPGNLKNALGVQAPLHAIQVFGVWLGGSYKLAPTGSALAVTHALIVLTLISAVLGAVHVLRSRAYALAGWLALMLLALLVVTQSVTTWAGAKTLMLTSPVVVLLAWGGVAALKALPSRSISRPLTALLALALAGGVFASDAMQYHASNLAPTARYEEMASLDSRFAGKGPTLFTDFDEYALYELRDLDVGGMDFIYGPEQKGVARPHGDPVGLDRVPPADLRAYPLIVTRRDPAASRPPSAYSLLWQGTYYQVWGRRAGAAPALAHVALTGAPSAQCSDIQRLAHTAALRGAQLVAADAPELVSVSLARVAHPAAWGYRRHGLIMSTAGRLSAAFEAPVGGTWEVWLQGEIMRAVHVSVDGHPVGSIGAQLGGNSLNPDTTAPLRVHLSAGRHLLSITRGGPSLAPGDGGAAILYAIFLTPAGAGAEGTLHVAAASRWRALCGRSYQWIEIVRA